MNKSIYNEDNNNQQGTSLEPEGAIGPGALALLPEGADRLLTQGRWFMPERTGPALGAAAVVEKVAVLLLLLLIL